MSLAELSKNKRDKVRAGSDAELEKLVVDAEIKLEPVFKRIDQIKNNNQIRVLEAFKDCGIQASHFSWVTGYGHDDLGKEKLDQLFAAYFKTESALVRPQIVSGTHAISSAILGNLNAGDELVALCTPYDTLQTVFKKFEEKYAIVYKSLKAEAALGDSQGQETNDKFLNDSKKALELVTEKTKMVFIQRSRGYEWRDSLTLDQIKNLILEARSRNPKIIVFVDNCYGEFTQEKEPTSIGGELENADLIAGSLIKNPGGGIAPAGGYIAGKKDLVYKAAEQLTAPGIGPEGGCMFDQTRLFFQGFFMAPLIVSEALKGMSLAAKLFADEGLETIPSFDASRNDVIQAIKFKDKAKLLNFCKIVQNNSPVNSMFTPIADDIPGYDDQVVMGSGTFIEGSTIELSADGPLREPYIGYIQGGLSYAHSRYVLKEILKSI